MVNLVWYKYTDLRTFDHDALINCHNDAIKNNTQVIHVFCIDPIFDEKTSFGFIKFSKYKKKFLFQSISNIYDKIKLNVYWDKPENIIPYLIQKYKVKKIFHYIDILNEDNIKNETTDVEWFDYWGNTMYDINNFRLEELENFTKFKHTVSNYQVKKVNEFTNYADCIIDIDNKELLKNELEAFNFNSILNGGESNAWKRLNFYFFESKGLLEYKDKKHNIFGDNYSSKISPYLAFGNISARSVYWQLKKYQETIENNVSTYCMWKELVWRDYFKFTLVKTKNTIFELNYKTNKYWRPMDDKTLELFKRWKTGTTGYPYIDANMIELNSTGYMSNTGRQMVSSFLVNELQIDWRLGAQYFESLLIDHDVASNYGNWNCLANSLCDNVEDVYYKVYNPLNNGDSECKFVKKWIPSLQEEDPVNILSLNLKNYHKLILS